MKFGVLQFFSWPGRRFALEEVYERALQRIDLMDRTGYDCVWLAEHHFTDYSVCPSVHMMGVHVANRTEHLRIGTAVSLAAFYHPLRLAEEVALLDQLTRGRVNWGAGRGFDPTEFATFDIPVSESRARFQEAVDIVMAAWANERLTWESENWSFDDIEVLPKPYQKPHPPMWVAAGSPPALEWAGKRGYTAMLGPHADFDKLLEYKRLFAANLQSNGHAMDGREIPMTRFIAMADTDAEAEEVARRGAAWIVDSYKNESKGMANPIQTVKIDGEIREFDPVERYLHNVTVWGSPERVVDELQRLREEIELDYLLCAPLSHASFITFTEKVMPRLL